MSRKKTEHRVAFYKGKAYTGSLEKRRQVQAAMMPMIPLVRKIKPNYKAIAVMDAIRDKKETP